MANKTNHFCKYQIDGVPVYRLLSATDYRYFSVLLCRGLKWQDAYNRAKETTAKGKGKRRNYEGYVHNRTVWKYKGRFIVDIFPDHNDRANFYRNLHKKGMSVADAFRRAKATQIERELKMEEYRNEKINKAGKDPD